MAEHMSYTANKNCFLRFLRPYFKVICVRNYPTYITDHNSLTLEMILFKYLGN
jgi:hypothetical protein